MEFILRVRRPVGLSWFQSNLSNYYKFNLKVAYQNVNSLMNNVDEVKEMLNKNLFDIFLMLRRKTTAPFPRRFFRSKDVV